MAKAKTVAEKYLSNRAAPQAPERRFYSRTKAFGRFGMRIFKPELMNQPHWHGHVEGNYIRNARMIYVVDGQRIGISIDQGIERMFERMPLSEVNFLGIVMAIQSKTGGNLSEALSNLSKVLRDRKKMKQKIRAVSQEAKSSAAIIGALPFVIMGALTVLNPSYMDPLFNTSTGNVLLVGCGVWMMTGVLVMRKMINFQI